MRKTTSRFWVDVVSFIAFFGLVVTGLIMIFFTDSGPRVAEAAKYFLNLHRHQWGGIHLYFAIAFVLFILIHLVLEWRWIVGKTRSLFKRAWMLVPVMAVAFLVVFLGWMVTPKTTDYYDKQGKKADPSAVARTQERQPELTGWKTNGKKNCVREKNRSSLPELDIRKENRTVTITGRDSFLTVQQKTGCPASRIVKHLGLPGDISQTERLGILRRRYGFSIHDVRDAIRALSN